MTRRDGVLVTLLLVALVVIGFTVATPVAAPVASPTPSGLPPVVYAIRHGVVGRPVSITPVSARTQADRDLVALLFRGLVRFGPDGAPAPDLASSWKSERKGARWTFTIRPDATWQDGTPVTSADVVFTIEILQDETYEGPLGASWQGVTVTALSDRTVRFDLEDPLAGFLTAAAQPLLPAHLLAGLAVPDIAAGTFAVRPIGNSALALEQVTADRAVLVPAFQAAPAGPLVTQPPVPVAADQPYAERVELLFYDTAADAAAAYRAGSIDMVSGLAPTEAALLATAKGSRLIRYPSTTLTAVVLNLRAGKFAFADKASRAGALAALDRDAMILGALAGAGVRADSLIPPTSWAFDAALTKPVAFSATVAAERLKAGGWTQEGGAWVAPKGTGPADIELLAPSADVNPVANTAARMVAADWKSLGIGVTLVELPAAEFVDRLRGASYTAAVVDLNVGLDPDLFPLLASSQSVAGGSNVSGYQDTALDKVMTTARTPGTVAARRKAFGEIERLLAAAVPILPLFFRDVTVVASGDVAGIEPRIVSDASQRFSDVITWRVVGR